jgi:OPA family glycerol-3-phosphate transporter-like MFS transporter
MMPTEFAVFGKASTVSGIFNSLIYAGSALSTYVFGAVAEHIGWNMTVALWLSLAVVSALLLIMGIKPWNRFLNDPKSYG